jgi:DNA-binding IclR family transcriptional regulator
LPQFSFNRDFVFIQFHIWNPATLIWGFPACHKGVRTMVDNKYSAPEQEKGLDIIELLSEQEFGLSQTEIARALGRSVGEIFRMLVVLQNRGFVHLDRGSDKYVLATLLFENAHRMPVVRRLTALAGPLMRRLAAHTNQSVHLAILRNGHVLVVGQVESPGNNVMSVRLGAKIDVWHTSSGRVILANSPEEGLLETARNVPFPQTTTMQGMKKELQAIRRVGHEVMDSFVVAGVVNISTPIIDHSGYAIAAIAVPHIRRLDSSISFDDSRRAVVDMSQKLSVSLGGRAVARVYGDGAPTSGT